MLGRKRFFGECYICDNDNATLYFYGYQDGDKERRYECAHCHTEHPECDVGELEADHKYNGTYPERCNEDILRALEPFGKLHKYVVRKESVVIHITDGFDNGMANYFKLLKVLNDAFAEEYPRLGTMRTDKDSFYITYKKEQHEQ